jgi:hypothetical protein
MADTSDDSALATFKKTIERHKAQNKANQAARAAKLKNFLHAGKFNPQTPPSSQVKQTKDGMKPVQTNAAPMGKVRPYATDLNPGPTKWLKQ